MDLIRGLKTLPPAYVMEPCADDEDWMKSQRHCGFIFLLII
jgi:hypothetical protein